ncbi:MAG: InlB B-repeat-containing protein, partial [Clostridiales bacterium]|nr:InlB B-repeat-containing protein [Clostridiales bacterium]MDY5726226.1 InlB B-repeat-containing protein [Eubacteriales bacterium]
LSSGRYQIRFKETDNYNAGEVVEVQVPESGVSSYNLTVIGGTGEGVFIQGASVTITANAPATGKRFSGWTIEGISGLDTTKTSLTFNMPAGNVTATANYEDIEYTITVNGGTADKSKAKCGDSVTITANVPATGKEFDKWVVTGITLSDEDLAKSTVTFEMPASNVTMEAHFRDIEAAPSIEIKVEGGTGAGTYKEGDSVTVTANEPAEGKVFKGWKDESGKIVSTNKSYTFTVNGETTLTAVYEDKPSGGGEITPPAKKDGLSGGAIAGIVIGSVAVAGIGGFAFLWFAVKKKTFADLITAIKALFTKKK